MEGEWWMIWRGSGDLTSPTTEDQWTHIHSQVLYEQSITLLCNSHQHYHSSVIQNNKNLMNYKQYMIQHNSDKNKERHNRDVINTETR